MGWKPSKLSSFEPEDQEAIESCIEILCSSPDANIAENIDGSKLILVFRNKYRYEVVIADIREEGSVPFGPTTQGLEKQ